MSTLIYVLVKQVGASFQVIIENAKLSHTIGNQIPTCVSDHEP